MDNTPYVLPLIKVLNNLALDKLKAGHLFRKKQTCLYFLASWFGAVYLALLFSILLLIYITNTKTVKPISTDFKLYTALPTNQSAVTNKIEAHDARAKIIENFFNEYNSDLSKYGKIFVTVADKYKLDYRLLPAIAMQESNGAKRMPKNSFNPFGFGIYGSKILQFTSFEEAIETVGKALREDYVNEGLNTTEKIMTKYNPPSFTRDGMWAEGVNHFMEELR